MTFLLPRRPAAVLAALFLLAGAARAELPFIAKTREYLGSEAALNAVHSIHYTGWLDAADPAKPGQQLRVAIDIVFQAPYHQRLIITREDGTMTTGLDSYDGWVRVQNPKDPSTWRLSLLGKDQIKRLRANTWENLSFFRGLEHEGGKVLDQGTATMEGVTCRKLAFVHADDIVFYRYFDQATGRLVATVTEAGDSIREQGEIVVNGIRFPKQILTTSKGKDGKEQTATINFEKVELNETFPGSIFAVPALIGK